MTILGFLDQVPGGGYIGAGLLIVGLLAFTIDQHFKRLRRDLDERERDRR